MVVQSLCLGVKRQRLQAIVREEWAVIIREVKVLERP